MMMTSIDRYATKKNNKIQNLKKPAELFLVTCGNARNVDEFVNVDDVDGFEVGVL